MSHVNYDTLPEYMVQAAQDYVENGVEPEPRDFLFELLCNDLVGVFKFGDDTNIAALKTWVTWLWWEVPSSAWGSPAKIKAWCERGGLEGGNGQ